ncbi:uncharacterized protein [Lolium perenne]|uniref:uncharacterized protein n=1 Tax=Lolium perenne TaxID=4522 RepID=UPI0021F692B5|nr:uncharacterized protein LOC127304565 [Lolium perenne]
MAPPEQSPPRQLQSPPSEQPILDELLEDIFLRLTTAADLARASTACVSFRRVIAGHAFLRRFRALHPPPLLGIFNHPFLPAQPPHPSAAAARAVADGADFWCSFLPSRERWGITDIRDGRVLLVGVPEGKTYPWGSNGMLRHFALCDPLSRRYLVLPAIPDDLVHELHITDNDGAYFLAPPVAGDDDGVSFRVMCLVKRKSKLVLFAFSRGAGQWRYIEYDPGFKLHWASRRYYWRRFFCWAVMPENKLLKLNTDKMEFSAVDLPPEPWPEEYEMTFVEASKGRLGMFTIYDDFDEEQGGKIFHLGYAILRKRRDRTTRWRSKAMISLPSTCRHYRIIGVAGGYLLLEGVPKDLPSTPSPEGDEIDIFSFNLQTLQLEPFCGATDTIYEDNTLYAGFPPSLSAPTI